MVMGAGPSLSSDVLSYVVAYSTSERRTFTRIILIRTTNSLNGSGGNIVSVINIQDEDGEAT
jgi:hypothetical protein